jgi:prolyl-tRNA synthetase
MKRILEETPGFIRTGWCGDEACEEKVKAETKATIRAIPFEQPADAGVCVACGRKGKHQVLFAKAY